MGSMSRKVVAVLGGSSRHGQSPSHIDAARLLGRLLRDCGYSVVCSGGRNGILGAMLGEYGDGGSTVTGVVLSGSTEVDELHDCVTEIRTVESAAERKLLFRDLSFGMVALPGGVGTLDEIFSFAFDKKQGRLLGPIILIDVEAYFLPLRQMMDGMLLHGLLRLGAKPDLFAFTTNAADALRVLNEIGSTG